jgi:hypothetical protein
VILADGNRASAGELIITRSNDRRLRTSATDWVKNGDRWIVLAAHRDGGLRVQQRRSGRRIQLPASYVRASVELGYATTIHSAQGITADTMHGLITGTESRQQLYTMCTRGRLSNHVYLQLVGDGDSHILIRPDTISPATATELLEQILGRDDTPRSAGRMLQDQQDPAVRLGDSVERYLDALHVAAEHVVGKSAAEALEGFANQLVPGLTDEPAWPSLRGHLLLLAADGANPHPRLRAARDAKEMSSADDRAAVLDWRLDDSSVLSSRDGPLPWLPEIPNRIAADPTWGPYLRARSHLIIQLADHVRVNARSEEWAARPPAASPELIADIQVWRAATYVDPSDLRPTGPPQLGRTVRIFQQQLNKRLRDAASDEDSQWRWLVAAEAASAIADPYMPELTEGLSNLARAGFDASLLVRTAAAERPLPDDYPAAALWWRILDQLAPQRPNRGTANPDAVPATSRMITRSPGKKPPLSRSAPPPASGPSR